MTAAATHEIRQRAYGQVYAYIALLGDKLPPDPVHRNAMIWRAVEAAVESILGPSEPTPTASCGCELCQSGEGHYEARCPTCEQIITVARGRYVEHWADPSDLRSRWCASSGMEAS